MLKPNLLQAPSTKLTLGSSAFHTFYMNVMVKTKNIRYMLVHDPLIIIPKP